MGTKERRAREFQQREDDLLTIACELLVHHGHDSITMERLAAEAEYSKGTLYKHFSCREDLLCALTTKRLREIGSLFNHALSYPGGTRDRMVAFLVAYELYASTRPHEFSLLLTLTSTPLSERASAERIDELTQIQESLIAILRELIQHAEQSGDLSTRTIPTDIDSFVFGLWTLCFGNYMIGHCDPELCAHMQQPNLEQHTRTMYQIMLDGVGWRPLGHERDYNQVAGHARNWLIEKAELQLD